MPGADQPTAPARDTATNAGPPSILANVAVLVAIGIGALVAWAAPLTSVVLIWPILFFVPGWVLIRRVVPNLSNPGAVGAAIVTSTYLSAHLVNVVARVGGFGREAIIVSAVLLALATLVVAQLRHRWLAPLRRPTRDELILAIWDDGLAWYLAIAVGVDRLPRPAGPTAGTRRPTAGSAVAGTGATSSSTSRSDRASRPATSRPRSRISRASR